MVRILTTALYLVDCAASAGPRVRCHDQVPRKAARMLLNLPKSGTLQGGQSELSNLLQTSLGACRDPAANKLRSSMVFTDQTTGS